MAASMLEAAAVPRPASNFTITLAGGRAPIQLSQYRGKVIAVEFILTYCSHCQRASRTAEVLYKEFGGQGFQVVAAAINPGGDVVAYSREHQISFPVGTASQETCLSFMQHPMGARLLMPQMAIIDRNFNIVEQHSGDDTAFFGDQEEANLRAVVQRLLKPAGAAPKAAPAKKRT